MKVTATRADKGDKNSTVRPAVKTLPGQRFANDPPSMEEPRLREMLKDPILLRLMSSDKVEPNQLQLLLDNARNKLFN